jgi:hypothetical protein
MLNITEEDKINIKNKMMSDIHELRGEIQEITAQRLLLIAIENKILPEMTLDKADETEIFQFLIELYYGY